MLCVEAVLAGVRPLFGAEIRSQGESCADAVVQLLAEVRAAPEDEFFCVENFFGPPGSHGAGSAQTAIDIAKLAALITKQTEKGKLLPDLVFLSDAPRENARLTNPTIAHKFFEDALGWTALCSRKSPLLDVSKLDYMYLEKTRLAGTDPACRALVLARAIQSARNASISAASGEGRPENSDFTNVTNSASTVDAASATGS